jgi:hypothetical protein
MQPRTAPRLARGCHSGGQECDMHTHHSCGKLHTWDWVGAASVLNCHVWPVRMMGYERALSTHAQRSPTRSALPCPSFPLTCPVLLLSAPGACISASPCWRAGLWDQSATRRWGMARVRVRCNTQVGQGRAGLWRGMAGAGTELGCWQRPLGTRARPCEASKARPASNVDEGSACGLQSSEHHHCCSPAWPM